MIEHFKATNFDTINELMNDDFSYIIHEHEWSNHTFICIQNSNYYRLKNVILGYDGLSNTKMT